MYESISKNNELENEMTLDMSYFWYSDVVHTGLSHAFNVSCLKDAWSHLYIAQSIFQEL